MGNKALLLREAGAVRRCHTVPTVHPYTVSQHVYGMLALLDALYPDEPPYALVRAVMYHDTPERWLGDMPGSAKAIDPNIKDRIYAVEEIIRKRFGFEMPGLTNYEKQWLKALDRIEFWMWCLDEYGMGNENIAPILDDMEKELERLDLPEECRAFVDQFEWKRNPDC